MSRSLGAERSRAKSWQVHPLVIRLRNAGRALGVNDRIAQLLEWRGYELGFRRAMLSLIREGDCVWDVGANEGLYARQFARLVGSGGQVCAYEPSAANRDRLARGVRNHTNVRIYDFALGAEHRIIRFRQGNDALGASSSVVPDGEHAAGIVVDVQMETGDRLISTGLAPMPDIMKIDAEGHELEILHGLRSTLANPCLRALGVEVHFGILRDRGFPGAPGQIAGMLEEAGFRCRWIAFSHLIASR